MASRDESSVNVIARFRPLNAKELKISSGSCISCAGSTVMVTQDSGEPLKFNFDAVFSPQSTQSDVYKMAAEPIVEAVMQGFNGTVLAYGQTSSGKTYTMMGPEIENEDLMGVIPRMVCRLFEQIENSDEHIEYTIKVAYAELYLEHIRDLLDPSKNNLKIHESRTKGIYIADLTETYVFNEAEVFDLMKIGSENRKVGYTDMNAGSSRSHSIFMLTLSQTNALDFSAKTGKLYLVDLAGSEKVGKTGAEGIRLEEAKNINKSLTTLGHVIFSLTDGKSSHIPYRDSKLTRVLQDSLGGNSKTSLIFTCSPSPFNEAETISTLRFGVRAKCIKNKPKVNKEYTIAELKILLATAQDELAKRDKQIKALESKLETNGIQVARVSEEEPSPKESIQYAYNDLVQEMEEVRTRLSETVAEHSTLKHSLSTLQTDYTHVSEEVHDLQEVCKLQKEAIQRAETRRRSYEETIHQLKEVQTTLEAEVKELNNAKTELEQQLLQKTLKIDQLSVEKRVRPRSPFPMALPAIGEEPPELNEDSEEVEYYKNQLKALTDRFEQYKKNLSEGEGSLLTRTELLERNLEKLTMMYYVLVTQKSQLKVSCQVNERRVTRLQKSNQELQSDVERLTEALAEERDKLKKLNDRFEESSVQARNSLNMSSVFSFAKNIRKTIKGGPRNMMYMSSIYG